MHQKLPGSTCHLHSQILLHHIIKNRITIQKNQTTDQQSYSSFHSISEIHPGTFEFDLSYTSLRKAGREFLSDFSLCEFINPATAVWTCHITNRQLNSQNAIVSLYGRIIKYSTFMILSLANEHVMHKLT